MKADLLDHFERRVRYTETRTTTPRGFPDFPIINPSRYYDPRYYDLEQKHVFRKSWLLAGHRDQLPQPSCYKTFKHAGPPVILFHGSDGEIRAFYNVCRHRGAVIATKEFGKSRTIACGYHSWVYDNKGELVSIREQRDFPDLDFKCFSLVPIRCEMLGGMIFINFDDDAPSLKDWFGPAYDDFLGEYAFDLTTVIHHTVWNAPCNWKLLIEGGVENYHGQSIHKKTLAFGRQDQGVISLYANGSSRDAFLQAKAKDEAALGGFVREAEGGVAEDRRPRNPRISEFSSEHNFFYNIFPNMNFGTFTPVGFATSCYWPTGLGTSNQEFYIFGYGDGAPHRELWDRDIKQARDVLAEDLDFIGRVQEGITSSPGVKLGFQESRIYHLNEALDAKIGIENVPPELRIEPVIGPEWIYPNDIPLYEAEMARVEGAAR
jgi:phenylpropionate dioxygenase-like ring-hydroxylating dioxygenase large terminal subunit